MTCNVSWMHRTNSTGRMKGLVAATTVMLSLAIPNMASAQSATLPEDLSIKLETRQDISSKTARVGDRVELAVAKPVVIGGVTLIPAGAPAVGEVVSVRDNGLLGRSGKLGISVSKLTAGEVDIAVHGQHNAQGKSGKLGAMGAGMIFPPLGIIIRGKDVKLPAGTSFDVLVDREVVMTPASVQPAAPSEQPQASGDGAE